MFRRILVPALAVLAFAGAACSSRSTLEPADVRSAPAGVAQAGVAQPGAAFDRPAYDVLAQRADSRGFVDLGFNRLTRVTGAFRARTILTGQQPGPWVEGTFSTERLVVGVQTPLGGGPTYRHERVRHLENSGPSTTYDLWRQDRSGLYLYQADVSARTVRAMPLALARSTPGAAFAGAWDAVLAKRAALTAGPPGGPTALEITFLRYPLHKGASWEGRPGFNVWTFEDFERLDTPGGHFRAARLRIELPEFFGPRDRALTWWDAPGEVKREYHLFGTAVDAGGNVLGELETIESFELVAYEQNVPL
ncbi:MAG: hypothetical protein ABIP29_01920 [Candidatus Eisenbacteria bacterium]